MHYRYLIAQARQADLPRIELDLAYLVNPSKRMRPLRHETDEIAILKIEKMKDTCLEDTCLKEMLQQYVQPYIRIYGHTCMRAWGKGGCTGSNHVITAEKLRA